MSAKIYRHIVRRFEWDRSGVALAALLFLGECIAVVLAVISGQVGSIGECLNSGAVRARSRFVQAPCRSHLVRSMRSEEGVQRKF